MIREKIGWLRDGLLFDIDQLLDPAFTHHGIKTTFQLIVRISRPVIDTIKVPLTGKVTRRVDEQIRLFNLKNTQDQNEIENYPELVPHLREREIWEAKREDARQHVIHESRLPWVPPTPPPEDVPSPPRHTPRGVLTDEEIEMELFIRAESGADEVPLDKLYRGPDETDDHYDMRIRQMILKDFPIHTTESGYSYPEDYTRDIKKLARERRIAFHQLSGTYSAEDPYDSDVSLCPTYGFQMSKMTKKRQRDTYQKENIYIEHKPETNSIKIHQLPLTFRTYPLIVQFATRCGTSPSNRGHNKGLSMHLKCRFPYHAYDQI